MKKLGLMLFAFLAMSMCAIAQNFGGDDFGGQGFGGQGFGGQDFGGQGFGGQGFGGMGMGMGMGGQRANGGAMPQFNKEQLVKNMTDRQVERLKLTPEQTEQKYEISKSRWLFPIIMNAQKITDHAHTPIGRCSDGPFDNQGQAANLQ